MISTVDPCQISAIRFTKSFGSSSLQKSQTMLALLLLAVVGTTSLADDGADTIRALRMESNDAIARHDVDKLQSFLDEDFVISISTGAIERSRAEHGRSFALHFEQFPDVVYVRTPLKIVLSEAYPLAIEHGTWVGSRTDKNGRLENGGQYTAAWRKTDGTWRIYSELYVGLYCNGVDC